MEDLSRKLEGELILDLEDDTPQFVEDECRLVLMGKLITDKLYNMPALKATVVKMWNPSKGVEVSDLIDNIVLFKFKAELD